MLKLLVIFRSLFLLQVLFFFSAAAFAFEIRGRLIHKGNPKITAGVAVVVLKINDKANEGGPPMFPVGRVDTDEKGAYSFKNLDFDVGSRFQIGALVVGNRIASDIFAYEGEALLEFDFDISEQLTLDLSPPLILSDDLETATVQGKVLNHQDAIDPGHIVFLQKFTLDEQGKVVGEILAETNLRDDLSFFFDKVGFDDKSVFKVGLYYKDLPILSELFSINSYGKVLDLLIPSFKEGSADEITIIKDAFLVSLSEEGFLINQFIYFFNDSEYVLDLKQPLFKSLPKGFYNATSPDINSGHVMIEGDELIIKGPFLPGERIVFLQYGIKNRLNYGNYEFGFLKNAQSLEFISLAAELNLDIKNFSSQTAQIKIANEPGYQSKNVSLVDYKTQNNPIPNTVKISLKSSFWPTHILSYVLMGVTSIFLLLGLVLYLLRIKKSKS